MLAASTVARVPLPAGLARFNKRVTNRIAGLIAGWAPGLGIIHHVGRKTGRPYQTVVNVFRTNDGYLFALTYGRTDWLENVIAAGSCELETRRRRVSLAEPNVFEDTERRQVPGPVRLMLGLVDVDQFVTMRIDRAD